MNFFIFLSYLIFPRSLSQAVADPHLQIKGGGEAVIQTLRYGGGAISKEIFSALRVSVWAKNKGSPDPSPGSGTARVQGLMTT